MKRFHPAGSASILMLAAVLALAAGADAQTGGGPSTPIRPTDNEKAPSTKMAHEELLKHVQELQVRMDLIRQVTEKMNGAPAGDRATAIKKSVLNLMFERDVAQTYPKLEASLETLRWHLHTDGVRKQNLADRRARDVAKTQINIDIRADDIIRLEAKASATGIDPAERDDIEQRLADRRAELNEMVHWRTQQEADSHRLAKDAESFKQESKELGKLQRHIDSLNRQARTRIGRIVDQIEYTQIAGVSEEIESARKTITEVMNILHNKPPTAPQANPPTLPSAKSAPIVRPTTPPQLETEAVRAEIQKARERAAKLKAMTDSEP